MSNLFFLGFTVSIIMLLLGLIKPSLVLYWGAKRTRGRSTLLYGLAIFAFFFGIGIVAPDTSSTEPTEAAAKNISNIDKPAEIVETEVDVTIDKNENDNTANQQQEQVGTENTSKIERIQLEQEYYSRPTFYEGELDTEGNPYGEGKVTYIWLDDEVMTLYVGGFLNGEYHGNGTLYYGGDDEQGEIQSTGIFENGEEMFFPYDNEFYYNKKAISFHGEQSKTKAGKSMKKEV